MDTDTPGGVIRGYWAIGKREEGDAADQRDDDATAPSRRSADR